MKPSLIKSGRVYQGADGSTRKVIRFSGGGFYRNVVYRSTQEREQVTSLGAFANWAVKDATPVSIVRLAGTGSRGRR
jgi:hypothetical protein